MKKELSLLKKELEDAHTRAGVEKDKVHNMVVDELKDLESEKATQELNKQLLHLNVLLQQREEELSHLKVECVLGLNDC